MQSQETRTSIPTPKGQGHHSQDQVVPIQSDFEHFQIRIIHCFSGQLFLVFYYTRCERFLPYMHFKLALSVLNPYSDSTIFCQCSMYSIKLQRDAEMTMCTLCNPVFPYRKVFHWAPEFFAVTLTGFFLS